MALPSKIKKNLPLTYPKTLLGRREELLEKINKDGTYLPKSLLHADLDRGFLDFVRDELKTVVTGKIIPTVDIIITTQNWSQFTETWDFQNIPQNKPVTHDFTFTNTGKEPIVITNCQASCGCTVPKWPKEPILPGKSDVISVTYNAAHAGGFNKSITITSNAKTPTKVIYIKGTVDAAPVEQTTPEQQPNMMQTNPK